MRALRCFWLRLTGGKFRRRESELDEEFAAHLELLTEENIRRRGACPCRGSLHSTT